MNRMIIIIVLLFIGEQTKSYASDFIYWEDLPTQAQDSILELPSLDSEIVLFYTENFRASDDDRTFNLLDTLASYTENREIKSLKFFLFNRILSKSDGALAEVMGIYSRKVVLNDIDYVLHYLSNNQTLFHKYADCLGYEFYFAEEMPYADEDKLRYFISQIEKHKASISAGFIQSFYKEIEKTMKLME